MPTTYKVVSSMLESPIVNATNKAGGVPGGAPDAARQEPPDESRTAPQNMFLRGRSCR